MPSDHGIVRRVRGGLLCADQHDSATAKRTHHATRGHAASLASIRACTAWPRHFVGLPRAWREFFFIYSDSWSSHSRSPIRGFSHSTLSPIAAATQKDGIANSVPPMRQILSRDGAYLSRAVD
ncbi:hypothetical protein EXIGLDRAFT_408048 [Exidia glandulosa HHB12029]|uniref:Uncharacterized protein n=1 Tax=Exidia glandulosa HHB12029 TaxID=1314781 RepID=A0A165KQW1_EXIGL|nr:hypothetical protein EXIGLDRAFT_408048 [Exidia glandulosa HHB12029]